VNLQIDRMKKIVKVITPYISNLWCDQFSENLVFSILNRVVLIQPHITEGRRCGTDEVRKPGFKITEVSVEHRLTVYCTYVHVPRTVRVTIFFGVCKTVLSVVFRRSIKSVFSLLGHFTRFLVYQRKFITIPITIESFLFTYVCM
jgi:hypothetical protein